jgi:dihydropteroate synthase
MWGMAYSVVLTKRGEDNDFQNNFRSSRWWLAPSVTLSLPHGKTLTLGSPVAVMGVVNVTPDSFSDGGAFANLASVVAHGERLAAEGAAILDVGGESSRPGASSVPADEEIARVVPTVTELSRRVAVPISVDTTKAAVAAAAIKAGASIVNDICGFQRDPEIARVVADAGAAVVLMHNRAVIDASLDIVADALDFLSRSIDLALDAGVARERLIVDPGFGFGKTPAQNLELIRRLGEFAILGCPLLLGVSRKSTIGLVTGQKIPSERLAGSLAAGLLGAANGAAILRVHDVAPHVQALQVLHAARASFQAGQAG